MTDVNHRLPIGDADDIFGQISDSMYFGLKPPQSVSRMAEKLFHKTPSNCFTKYRQIVSRFFVKMFYALVKYYKAKCFFEWREAL